MTIIAIFKIPSGMHYKTCDDLKHASVAIMKDFEHFHYLLPKLSLEENETGDSMLKKCKQAIKKKQGFDKAGFIKMVGENL